MPQLHTKIKNQCDVLTIRITLTIIFGPHTINSQHRGFAGYTIAKSKIKSKRLCVSNVTHFTKSIVASEPASYGTGSKNNHIKTPISLVSTRCLSVARPDRNNKEAHQINSVLRSRNQPRTCPVQCFSAGSPREREKGPRLGNQEKLRASTHTC